MKKYFVISDTHSFYTETVNALKEKGYDQSNIDHILILCGDAFDRGSESKRMFEWMKSLPKDRFIYIRGNHEDLLKKCYDAIVSGDDISRHHYSNGTVNTISDLAGVNDIYDYGLLRSENTNRQVQEKLKEVLDFIEERCVNYFETDNYIFVHGWIPCKKSDDNIYHIKNINYIFDKNWRKASFDSWESSRWMNGIDAWNQGVREDNKTTVCGHWHCSWGWSHIDQKRKEFPAKNLKNWKKSFEPYIKEGITAIDACTAYSGFVNCIVLED